MALVAALVLVLLGVIQNLLDPQALHTLTGRTQHVTG